MSKKTNAHVKIHVYSALVAFWVVANTFLPAKASGIEALKLFFEKSSVLSADFSQQTYSSDDVLLSEAIGSFQFERPDKFNIQYSAPYRQSIVSDGETIWFYDESLNQVTLRPYDSVRGQNIISILASASLEENFILISKPSHGDMDWVSVTPQKVTEDEEISDIRVALSKNTQEVRVISFRDPLGNETSIHFTFHDRDLQPNPDVYIFNIPENAEILQEFE